MDDERPGEDVTGGAAPVPGPLSTDPPSGASAPPPPPPLPSPPWQHEPPVSGVATNGQAVAALVLGIVGVVLFWTIWLGVILGTLAVVFGTLGRSKGKQGASNQGLATAGIVLGIVAIVASVLFVILLIAFAADAEELIDRIDYCSDHPSDPMC